MRNPEGRNRLVDENPRFLELRSDLRLSRDSIATVSTVNTRASSVLPAAQHNLGKTDSVLGEYDADTMQQEYFQSNIGQKNQEHFQNMPIEAKKADILNQAVLAEQTKGYKTVAAEEKRKKKRRKYGLLLLAIGIVFLAIIGVVIAMDSSDSDDSSIAGVSPDEITTEAPTTEAPTTEAPTTEAPTTEAPTTAAPTTAAPTTAAPTTAAPTTEAPTEAPTTGAPTTAAPTTAAPTEGPTEAPTTSAPTEAPTTSAPTKAPTTGEPTTGAPTGNLPSIIRISQNNEDNLAALCNLLSKPNSGNVFRTCTDRPNDKRFFTCSSSGLDNNGQCSGNNRCNCDIGEILLSNEGNLCGDNPACAPLEEMTFVDQNGGEDITLPLTDEIPLAQNFNTCAGGTAIDECFDFQAKVIRTFCESGNSEFKVLVCQNQTECGCVSLSRFN